MPRLSPALLAALCGVLLALTLPPLPTGVLAPLPLGALLWLVASAPTPRAGAARMLAGVSALSAVHLWWLVPFLVALFGLPPLGALAGLLYVLEGSFFAVMALLACRLTPNPAGRVWALAGGWVLLEWLRTLGPLAFPWPTLGAALLPTPLIQVADLGGVLLCSLLVTGAAAALVQAARGQRAPLLAGAAIWLAALGYGLTRTPGEGPVQPMLVVRSSFDTFDRALGRLSPAQQFEVLRQGTDAARQPGEVVVWSETAVSAFPGQSQLPGFPGPGVTGLGTGASGSEPQRNSVVSVDAAGTVLSRSEKARLVPFGEYFPLYSGPLRPVYSVIENALGFRLPAIPPAQSVRPLLLQGVLYGAYICYDSVFSWVARDLAAQGAQVLVNPSNDGWYSGWGVSQHFWMGRVRAIETRRWLVRSVNDGVAGAVDDLGRPVETISAGEGLRTLHVRPRLLDGQTPFVRLGHGPALLLAALLVGLGWGVGRRQSS
ncbi:apolipoprotein N-acyltransferase [Deinococcus petrolearius]|uniref:Apolipoprotein N-acyltransferase n=1 Tax=Deinococcus petrolearius TaxID=1751295 RepID=A0ABW1DGV6_9DEIO